MNPQADHDHLSKRPVTNRLHPRVYAIFIALVAWFAVAMWSFAGIGLVNYLLFIVSGFTIAVVVFVLILSRVGSAKDTEAMDHAPSWRKWAERDYDTSSGRLVGSQAAVQILLPVIAAAVGMTVIGFLFMFAERAVA